MQAVHTQKVVLDKHPPCNAGLADSLDGSSSGDEDEDRETATSDSESDISIDDIITDLGDGLSLMEKFPVLLNHTPPSSNSQGTLHKNIFMLVSDYSSCCCGNSLYFRACVRLLSTVPLFCEGHHSVLPQQHLHAWPKHFVTVCAFHRPPVREPDPVLQSVIFCVEKLSSSANAAATNERQV